MKKYVFYPILFSINPVLLLLAANISDLPLSQLFPVILISPIAATLLLWLVNKWLKDIHRAGFITFLASVWFFHYGTVHLWANSIHLGSVTLGTSWIFFPLWTLFFILLASGLLWKRVTSSKTITFFLNVVCIILVAFSILRISFDIAPRYLTHPNIPEEMKSLTSVPHSSNLPDVYYIILDGYARDDVLQEYYQYDNSSFIEALQDRGFIVASQSHSNYMQTALSLSSSLNMEYLTGFSKLVPDRGQLIGLIRNSLVRAIFESLGYKTVAFSTGYQLTDLTNADYYFTPPTLGKSRSLEALLLINSAADILIEQKLVDLPISRYSTEQETINYTFTTLANEIPVIAGPKFIYAHFIAPHPPFIFDQNGPVTPDEMYVLQDGDKFWGSKIEYIQKYIGQLSYINSRVIQTIDEILTNSSVPPIIIIQADHGPGAYLNRTSVDKTCLNERFSILNAYYLPGVVTDQLNNNVTSVNTFRIILNYYFGTNLDLLENKQYFSSWEQPFNFIDVTDKVEALCNIR
jgi:hypothetical protein